MFSLFFYRKFEIKLIVDDDKLVKISVTYLKIIEWKKRRRGRYTKILY